MTDKHLVFLVHGIGVHHANWSNDFQLELEKLSRNYHYFKINKLKDQLEFNEITYDKIFRDQIENWQLNFDNLISLSPTASQQSIREALDWMNGMSDQKENFLWTHVADAVLWKISPYLRNHVITSVARCLAEGINKKIEDSLFTPNYSIVGHSMGTSVVQQTLEALAKGAWSGETFNAFNANDVRFNSIHMIANVGHYFETAKKVVYQGYVRPGIIDGLHGYCNKYFNYVNKYDPVCWLGRFSPDWTVDDGYCDIPISHIHAKDTHDYIHYLQNPKVHIPLLRSITSRQAVSAAEELKAMNEFKQIDGDVAADINEYKAKIAELQASFNQFKDLSSWIKGWTAFGEMK